jgi:ABC-type uncharacterized transport system substrate-binding protein
MADIKIAAWLAGGSLAALALAGTTLPAAAHPHVWILAWSDVVFDDQGRIVAINVEWEFDEFYSAVALEGLDANGDGRYDTSELQGLAAENMASLSDFNYLMNVQVDGAAVEFGTVSEFGSNHRDPYLTLHFQVPLAEPVDPRVATFAYRVYDPSFYIAIDYKDAEAVKVVGTAPEPCALRVVKAAGNEAAAEQQPETFYENLMAADDLGSLYADTVTIDCKGGPET